MALGGAVARSLPSQSEEGSGELTLSAADSLPLRCFCSVSARAGQRVTARRAARGNSMSRGAAFMLFHRRLASPLGIGLRLELSARHLQGGKAPVPLTQV
jgi:hypothetical protein